MDSSPSHQHTARPAAGHLGDVLVLGLGATGEAVARYACGLLGTRVSSVTVADAREGSPSVVDSLMALGARVLTSATELHDRYHLAVCSPGIPPHSPLFRAAAQQADEAVGEPEFAWRESPGRWLAVTGTNGKTTTTTLLRDLLRADGLAATAVGNIGTVATGRLATRGRDEWFVAELSSFQLHGTRLLHPRGAVVLNLTPDHLSWHGSMERYAASKERAFANLTPRDLAVANVDDPAVAAMGARAAARGARVLQLSCTRVPDARDAAFRANGRLVVRLDGRDHDLIAEDGLLIPGAHNVQNALAASSLALFAGAAAPSVSAALASFAPLEHRIEPCGERGGVRFVNDSKATDTDAVQKAVATFPPGRVVLLVGGRDKGIDLTSFCAQVAPCAKVVVCFGEAGPRLAEAFRAARARVLEEPRLAEATLAGAREAARGDVVLLSPACASFDEFSGFEERGRAFKALVADLCASEGA